MLPVGLAAARSAVSSTSLGAASRAFHHARVVCMGHGSHVSNNDPDVLEAEKQRALKGEPSTCAAGKVCEEVVPGLPGWNPKLASESEEVVKADRLSDECADPLKLQEHTVNLMKNCDEEGSQGKGEGRMHNPSEGSPAIQENLEYSKRTPAQGPKPDS